MKRFINTAPLILNPTTTTATAIQELLRTDTQFVLVANNLQEIIGYVTLSQVINIYLKNPSSTLAELVTHPLPHIQLRSLTNALRKIVADHESPLILITNDSGFTNKDRIVGTINVSDLARYIVTNAPPRLLNRLIGGSLAV